MVGSRGVYAMTVLAFLRPETMRTILLVLVGGCYLAYHVVGWWRVWRKSRKPADATKRVPPVGGPTSVTAVTPGGPTSVSAVADATRRVPPVGTACREKVEIPAQRGKGSGDAREESEGADLYAQARALPHQPIPDFVVDGEYLDLLGKAAAKGYGRAMTKLGEYAMRRAAWIEAYYWMTSARRNGMHGLSPVLRDIRTSWARAGFPDQSLNVSAIFTVEAGSIGRALLSVDSGQNAAKAREFLRRNHPEFLGTP